LFWPGASLQYAFWASNTLWFKPKPTKL
jgi:hypothetical protein